MEKKDKIRLIICIIIAIFIISFTIYHNKPNNKIKRYIINRDFRLDENNTFYYKQISSNTIYKYNSEKERGIKTNYDYLYFDIYNYKLSEIISEYEDNYESSININYLFKTDTINYTYRINSNKINMIFKGTYIDKKDKFTCKKEFAYNIGLEEKAAICDTMLIQSKKFIKIKDMLFTNKKIQKILKK